MSLVRRKGSPFWWIDIAVPAELQARVGKARIKESTKTTDKKAAQQLHDEMKASLWRQDKLGEAPDGTLAEAIKRWKRHAITNQLRNIADVESMLEWWQEKLGATKKLSSITRQDIMRAVEGKMTIPRHANDKPRPASPARINRYLAAIRGLLRLAAREWEMIKVVPEIKMLREPPGRKRVASKEELQAIIDALPEHLRGPLVFALATGMRQSNVIQLTWGQVDLERSRLLVDAGAFKNKEDFGLPLNEVAKAVLQKEQGKHETAVFTYEGKPLGALQHKTWKAALIKAGVQDLHWHDLRHTWATMLVEAGEDLDRVQALGGWKSAAMMKRYAHLRTEHLRGSAQRVDKDLEFLVKKDPAVVP